MEDKDPDYSKLVSRISALEKRISDLENRKSSIPLQASGEEEQVPEEIISTGKAGNESVLESNVGGLGLALIGNIVLLFGIIFLWQYFQKIDYPVLSFVFGYVCVVAVFLASVYLRTKIANMSQMFSLVGQLALYYITLHLSFYTDHPLLPSRNWGIALLILVIAYQVFISVRNNSSLYAVMAVVMTFVTGIISDSTYFMMSTATIIAVGSVLLFFRYRWKSPLFASLFLAYALFLIWMMNNPLLLEANNVNLHHACNLFLLSCGMAFSFITLAKQHQSSSKNFLVVSVLLNGMNFSIVLVFFVFSFFINNYVILFVTISVFCILFSIILKRKSDWEFSPAIYAMYGFVAISVSVYGIFGVPYVFLMLALQSLLVLAMALWFRSRIILGLNAAMFFMLLITYVFASGSVDLINFSFAIVALVTARVLNLKKQLLNLEANYLRNMYLVTVFLMVLYSLHKALPESYITLSWTLAAIVFFIFNLALHNVKYRLMALSAVIAAAFRLFLVDLTNISFAYRVIAFLFLAVISISISLYYNTTMKEKNASGAEDLPENKTEEDQPNLN